MGSCLWCKIWNRGDVKDWVYKIVSLNKVCSFVWGCSDEVIFKYEGWDFIKLWVFGRISSMVEYVEYVFCDDEFIINVDESE